MGLGMTKPEELLVPSTPHVPGDGDIGEIRTIVGFHIRLAHGATYRHFTETFADRVHYFLFTVPSASPIVREGRLRALEIGRASCRERVSVLV